MRFHPEPRAGRSTPGIDAGRRLALIVTFAMGFSARPIDSASAVPAASSPALAAGPAAAPAPPPPARRATSPGCPSRSITSLKQGRLRLWVDGTLRLDKRLGKGTVARVALRPLGDSARGGIEVAPGVHDVKVEVAWDDNVRTERVRATFRPGDRRVLAARFVASSGRPFPSAGNRPREGGRTGNGPV